jgi:non-ribosomal peptide synthetase component E (peptide arylation enzyme)
MTIGSVWDGRTFWALIGGAAQREPHRRLLADEHGRSLTTRELHDAACATAAAFAIIGNAENVSALEIANVLATHPAVADVAVIGVPDRSAGERVCAVVIPTSADSVSLEALVRHCRSHGLSQFKSPERLVILDTLPRNQFGKVLKKDLREAFG